ncbi:MAG TPA: tyrosine-type recombinase/integrase [Candidatus Thermoplasmatota archaeon]|nr:tyrosine-type recombinase/integrase [Candidatus Thermoplasmatota archaeon]
MSNRVKVTPAADDGIHLSPDKDALLADYLVDLEAQQVTHRTVLNYKSNVRIYLAFLGHLDACKAGTSEFARFLKHLKEERELGAKSIMRYFNALSSFYSYLEFMGRIEKNALPLFRERYLGILQREAKKDVSALRQLISVEEMRALAHSMIEARDRAVLVLLAKTGVRREELVNMDLEDVDFKEQSITLKPTPKRTNLLVFFDDETSRVLKRWLVIREARGGGPTGPLFLGDHGGRLDRNRVYEIITEAAEAIGLHKKDGRLKDKFTPHCARHFFTSHLRRASMPPEYVAWLRGDKPAHTIDLYTHIDPKAVRESYRARIPQLGF